MKRIKEPVPWKGTENKLYDHCIICQKKFKEKQLKKYCSRNCKKIILEQDAYLSIALKGYGLGIVCKLD